VALIVLKIKGHTDVESYLFSSVHPVGLSLAQLFVRRALPFSVLWFAANYFFNIGTPMTTTASVLSLEQCSLVFVFILSVVFLQEKVTPIKIIAVLCLIGGGIMVGFSDSESSDNSTFATSSVLGDILIVCSTVCSALYMVGFKVYLGRLTSIWAVFLYLSMIGCCDFLFYWPGQLIVHYTNFEVFALPSLFVTFVMVIILFVSLIFNVALNLVITWSSPLFMRVAQTLTVPLSFAVEVLVFATPFSWLKCVGALLILGGFFVFTCFGESNLFRQCEENCRKKEMDNNDTITDTTKLLA